jgi:uncharacterized membrane protein YsdA (DUF1294 family)
MRTRGKKKLGGPIGHRVAKNTFRHPILKNRSFGFETEASVLKPKLRFCPLLGGNNSFWVAIKKVGHPMAKRVAKSPFCHRVCTIY